jgi:hypothetical protein
MPMTSLARLKYSRSTHKSHVSRRAEPFSFQIALEISCMSSSSAGILVADIHGSVHLLNKDFEVVTRWVVHVGGRVTHMIEKKGILLTLGVRSSTNNATRIRATNVKISGRGFC